MATRTQVADAHGEQLELIERARGLFPLLRGNMAKADAERRLPEENIEALVEAGLFRTFIPRRYGGYEVDVKTHLRISAELARACPATAWNVSMMTACGFLGAMLPVQAQDEIFGENPDARFAGVFSPPTDGTPAQPVDGGYVVSGKWPFASGCLHSDWSMVAAPLLEGGEVVNSLLLFAPRSELTIEDTWYVLGMRGTGSNTLAAEELFVPAHRTLTMMGPEGIMESVIPSEHRDEEPLYRVPIGLLGGAVTGIACLGMARAALEHVLERLPSRSIAYSARQATDAVPNQVQVADAATRIDCAAYLFDRLAEDLDAAGRAGGPPADMRLRGRARNDAAYAVQLCRQALDALLTVSGASSMRDGSLLQQLHRDMRVASLHAFTSTTTTLEQYGAALSGQPPTAASLLI